MSFHITQSASHDLKGKIKTKKKKKSKNCQLYAKYNQAHLYN